MVIPSLIPLTAMSNCASATPDSETAHLFDARGVARRFRHSAIFGALGALYPGETMRFVNDHDPIPLLQQLQAHYGTTVDIAYRQRDAEAVVIDFVKR